MPAACSVYRLLPRWGRGALLPQFLILTSIFMGLSVTSLSLYAALASRAKGVLTRPDLSRWVSRVVGSTFICFGAAILTMRRQAA
jgi:threonine/homoserine/homoserine lactone efflux protein